MDVKAELECLFAFWIGDLLNYLDKLYEPYETFGERFLLLIIRDYVCLLQNTLHIFVTPGFLYSRRIILPGLAVCLRRVERSVWGFLVAFSSSCECFCCEPGGKGEKRRSELILLFQSSVVQYVCLKVFLLF